MSDLHHNEVETPLSVSHVVHVLRAYAPAIILATLAVEVASFIVSLLLYLTAPAQRITTQPFRLDFKGAANGEYPNGLKFSSAEIVSGPILLRVYHDNNLERFTDFNSFSRSIFVLEANAEYETLAADYRNRLADTRLSPVDRERLQRDWEAKSAAIKKNDYSINYLRTEKTSQIPESVVRKVLSDILSGWAAFSIHEQHVLSYRMAVLSPNLLASSDAEDGDFIIALQVLREKMFRVANNVRALGELPGAELVRTPKDQISLEEIRVRLEEITRYRIEPLTSLVRSNGLIQNPAATLRYLESQLAYDQRSLQWTQDQAKAIRDSLSVYAMSDRSAMPDSVVTAAPQPANDKSRASSESVVMNDSFIDRVVTMVNQSGDMQYRQKQVDDYKSASQAIIPAQLAVDYDKQVIDFVRGAAPAAGNGATAEHVRAQIAATQAEVRKLVQQVNEIYEQVSRNLNPSTELYALTAPPSVHAERTRNLSNLLLYDFVAILATIPVAAIICLLHARLREEEGEEATA